MQGCPLPLPLYSIDVWLDELFYRVSMRFTVAVSARGIILSCTHVLMLVELAVVPPCDRSWRSTPDMQLLWAFNIGGLAIICLVYLPLGSRIFLA